MSDMKCPFCQQELKDQWVGQYVAHEYFDCPKCKMNGNTKLWQELIRTRKALDVAVDTLKYANKCLKGGCVDWMTHIDKALEQIIALEQKDK